MTSVEVLFEPFTSQKLSLPNRIVMAPMTRSFSPGGVPGEDVAAYYRKRAEGGTGLILTEGTAPDHPSATANSRVPHFYGAALAGWQRVADEVHAAGGKIMPQLWHVGGVRTPMDTLAVPVLAPSGLGGDGKEIGKPMSESEIADVIAGYVRSAGTAHALGFDGVEIHAAHGYLIDQFFWEKTNKRNDQWGGDFVARTRFGAEVIKAIRAEVGEAFPILFRFSQWKGLDYNARLLSTAQELERFLAPLTDAGVDIFHASTRRFWESEFEGSPLNLAGWTKKLTGLPTISVGSVGLSGEFSGSFRGEKSDLAPIDNLLERMERKEFDLIAIGRMLIAEPEWPKRIRTHHESELKPFSRELLGTLA